MNAQIHQAILWPGGGQPARHLVNAYIARHADLRKPASGRDGMVKLNRAAFSRDDVEDAKRGAPDFDLHEYAGRRDLEFLEHRTPAGFRAAVSGDEELQSNVMRGVLPGGAWGVMAHEGLQVGWTNEGADWGGDYYGVVVELGGGGLKGLLPFSGRSNTGTARVPCTLAATLVPESVSVQPYLRIDTRRSAPPYVATHRVKLGDKVGDDRWSAWADPAADPGLAEALVAEPVAGLLRHHSQDGLFQINVWWGTLVVRRNGYLGSEESLDELGQATALINQRVREVCRDRCDPQPFETELPSPRYEDIEDPRELPPGFIPSGRLRSWSRKIAKSNRLVLEDPVSLHRALPSIPIPGVAVIAMHGDLPDVGPGRLVICRERDVTRPAVLVKAPPGAKPMQPGGHQLKIGDIGLRLQVADGIVAAWSNNSYTGAALFPAVDPFVRAADEALRRLAQTDSAGDDG
jgi:hypothetical protein